ncbi:hypothetical protein VARIO8X_60342 [Burkholderiales bacterium 8X]|nr:hypothetical protein VARIO8X_60342 [Burkholderiales bacterium 8X]
MGNVQAQAQVSQQFHRDAAREIGTYANKKYEELKNNDPAEAAKWAEGGGYRLALHTAAGALGGGIGGAIGAGVGAALMPRIGQSIEEMNLPGPVAQALGAISAAVVGGIAGGIPGAASAYNADINNRQLHPSEAKLISNNAKRYAQQRFDTDSPTGSQINQAEIELTQQSLREFDTAHAQRLGADDPRAQAFLKTLGAGQSAVDPLTGQSFELFRADSATRENHAIFGQYVKENITEQALLDRAYTRVVASTISGLNGSYFGAMTGSDLSLNDAARDYANMREQPAVVQWGVLGELRGERQINLQRQLALTEELQQLNARGDTSAQAAKRRGEITNDLDLLGYENRTLRSASVEQIRAMGTVGLLSPINQREWGEGMGEALGVVGLNLGGLSTASVGGRITMLRGALAEAQASSAATIAEAQIARVRVENNVNADGTFAGGIPIRPRDGATPMGTAQTDTPIGRHLVQAGVRTNKQGQAETIEGGHNMTNFKQTLDASGGRIIGTPSEVAPGIYQIEYIMPGTLAGKKDTKTVYDPARYSDQQMASMANSAASQAVYQWLLGGGVAKVEFVTVNGVKFEVPIGKYRSQIYVPTAYPSGK